MTTYAVIASGQNVSGDVDLRKHRLQAIFVPTLSASGNLAIQGAMDQTSAGFVRFIETRQPGSGDMLFATGVGSRMIPLPDYLPTPPFARFEVVTAAGSFQAAPTTLTLITRPRN